MRQILIVNNAGIASDELARGVAAVQQQIDDDFRPWVGSTQNNKLVIGKDDKKKERIYLDATSHNLLGYHTLSGTTPIGHVYAKTSADHGKAWTSILSYEVMSMLVDPYVNGCAAVDFLSRAAIVAHEVASPVEGDEYQKEIGGIKVTVANFVLPTYFIDGVVGKVDFLGKLKRSLTLRPGGHISFMHWIGKWMEAYGDTKRVHRNIIDSLTEMHLRHRYHSACRLP